ncbi:hypothetical protein, partial [Nodularia sphaerocarpa]
MNQKILYSLCLTGIVSTLIVQSASAEVVQTKSGFSQDMTRERLGERLDFSRDLENPSPNLSPARREALNFPPSLVGKG